LIYNEDSSVSIEIPGNGKTYSNVQVGTNGKSISQDGLWFPSAQKEGLNGKKKLILDGDTDIRRKSLDSGNASDEVNLSEHSFDADSLVDDCESPIYGNKSSELSDDLFTEDSSASDASSHHSASGEFVKTENPNDGRKFDTCVKLVKNSPDSLETETCLFSSRQSATSKESRIQNEYENVDSVVTLQAVSNTTHHSESQGTCINIISSDTTSTCNHTNVVYCDGNDADTEDRHSPVVTSKNTDFIPKENIRAFYNSPIIETTTECNDHSTNIILSPSFFVSNINDVIKLDCKKTFLYPIIEEQFEDSYNVNKTSKTVCNVY